LLKNSISIFIITVICFSSNYVGHPQLSFTFEQYDVLKKQSNTRLKTKRAQAHTLTLEVIKMTTNKMKKVIPAVLSLSMIFSPLSAFAGTTDFGHVGAAADQDYTLEDMLNYAIEDEYLAKAEYEKIMAEFDVTRPFSNIMKAETQHISALLPLFEKYDIAVPANTASEHLIIPDTLAEIYSIGVEAEVANIAMYEKFLADPDLPADVKAVFTALMNGSENHLKAFERADDRASSGAAVGAASGQAGAQARNGNSFKGGNGGLNKSTSGFRATGVRNGLGTGLQDGSCLE
jgi:hypothetical protein